jgi:hypothetical protein
MILCYYIKVPNFAALEREKVMEKLETELQNNYLKLSKSAQAKLLIYARSLAEAERIPQAASCCRQTKPDE